MKCIFCEAELFPATKPEHILLAALGGKKTSRRIVCSECNNDLGSVVDKELTDQVAFVRSLLRLQSGDGSPAPMRKKVKAGDDVINVLGDGTLELSKPFEAIRNADGTYALSIKADSPEEFEQNIRHIAAMLGTTEQHIMDQINASGVPQITRRPGVIQQSLSFGGPLANRSIVKSCLELWAIEVGNEEILSASYEDTRRFVRLGDEAYATSRIELDSRYLPMLDELTAKFGDFFNLIYVASDETGRVVGHFTLYNLIAWQIILADRGGSPNRRVALISNPEMPNEWSDTIAEGLAIDWGWLTSPDYYGDDLARARTRLAALMKYHQKESLSQNALGIIEEVIEKHGLSGKPADPMSEAQKRMIGEMSNRFALSVLNLPYEEKLSADDLRQFLERSAKRRT